MAYASPPTAIAPTYMISRASGSDSYSVWKMDPDSPSLFTKMETAQDATFPASRKLCPIGGYMLAYDLGPLSGTPSMCSYELFTFDPTSNDPLNASPVQRGAWPGMKFFQYFDHYTWDPSIRDIVHLVPMTGYVMVYIPTAARGTYMLYNFDPAPTTPGMQDPLPNALCPQDAFSLIGEGSVLLPVNNYVLEWIAEHSKYRVWNFDPSDMHPLSLPYMSDGQRTEIGAGNQLVVLGEQILDIDPETRAFRLWDFDPKADDPFVGPVVSGTLPDGFDASADLTSIQTTVPVNKQLAATPGTMDFMRENVDHLVVYMLESRTMDSVLGWLYDQDSVDLNFIDAEAPFKANSFDYSNTASPPDGGSKPKEETFHPYLFNDGKLSKEIVLAAPAIDPFHATADCIDQQFSGGFSSYLSGDAPDMGGFVSNAVSKEAMVTFAPEQLPVLHGIAADYAVSDYWFSPMPGGTIPNRAYALTGSNHNITVNCEGEPQYSDYTQGPMRQPIWKVLQNNGITDWKIYYSVIWGAGVFTYHLFLRNQLPSVDAHKKDYVQPLDQFMADAAAGNLPKFSFLEPAWIAPTGATSYHPGATGDMVPGEVKLNEIFQALRNSPQWEKTAFVITFSKGGGLYDHEVTPPTVSGWPQDVRDGFKYDVLGPRVPTIVVSPRVKQHSVFRSGDDSKPFEGTSLISTLLDWCGIPRGRWGLGDRAQEAPTFEAVFQLKEPRQDHPKYRPPYDSKYQPKDSDA